MSHPWESSLWVVLEVQYSVPSPRQAAMAERSRPGPRIAQRGSDLGFHLSESVGFALNS